MYWKDVVKGGRKTIATELKDSCPNGMDPVDGLLSCVGAVGCGGSQMTYRRELVSCYEVHIAGSMLDGRAMRAGYGQMTF